MSNTPNLNISLIASNQASKEVTANSAFSNLDLAMTNKVSIAMTDADYTLADPTEARQNLVFKFTGTLTADRNIIVPNSKKQYIVQNATTGGFNLTVKTAAGTGIIVANDSTSFSTLYGDGTNVVSTASAGMLSKTLTHAQADADYTMTTVEASNYLCYVFTGALTNNRNITVPNTPKLFLISNQTTGGFDLVFTAGAGLTVNIPPSSLIGYGGSAYNRFAMIYSDGATNVIPLADLMPNGLYTYDTAVIENGVKFGIQSSSGTLGTGGYSQLNVADATAAPYTITLPAVANAAGFWLCFKKKDATANLVTLATTGADKIDGAATYTGLSAQYKFVQLFCDGTTWHIVAAN